MRIHTDRLAPRAAYLLVAVGAVVMLLPFYFMFVFATHARTEIFNLPPPLFFGHNFLANLDILTSKIPFWRNLGWSLYVALASTGLTLLFCSMGGYAFAMFEFRFKQPLFVLVMGTMLLPSFLGMIPTFMIMDALGWIDQPRALYIPGAASAFGIFMMRQFVSSAVPRELIEAARYLEHQRGDFGRQFLNEVEAAIGTIMEAPARWRPWPGDIRRFLLSSFRYTIRYRIRRIQSLQLTLRHRRQVLPSCVRSVDKGAVVH
jgi:multiple sugar transport system permease protein